MQERTFAYLISEDGGKHWRQVGWVGEAEMDKIIERQVAAGNKAGVADDIGRIRYKFVTDGEESMTITDAAGHVDYPHHPGFLVDCGACEARCHCTPRSAMCVYIGYHRQFCRTCDEPSDNGEGWDGECGNCADVTYRKEQGE